MHRTRTWGIAALLSLAACGGGSEDPITGLDPEVIADIEAIEACLPTLYPELDRLLDVLETWRLNDSTTADPPGLSWNEGNNGVISLQYVVGNVTLAMTITFYSPTGGAQDLDLASATTLGEAIALAATSLRNSFPNADPFMVGDWTVAGGGVAGGGAITGVIGGTANGNELEELRTTTAFPQLGLPPGATNGVAETGGSGCDLEFFTDGLQTDSVPDQAYPIGRIDVTIRSPDVTRNGTITFDNTVNAEIRMDGIPGLFLVNLDTLAINYEAP